MLNKRFAIYVVLATLLMASIGAITYSYFYQDRSQQEKPLVDDLSKLNGSFGTIQKITGGSAFENAIALNSKQVIASDLAGFDLIYPNKAHPEIILIWSDCSGSACGNPDHKLIDVGSHPPFVSELIPELSQDIAISAQGHGKYIVSGRSYIRDNVGNNIAVSIAYYQNNHSLHYISTDKQTEYYTSFIGKQPDALLSDPAVQKMFLTKMTIDEFKEFRSDIGTASPIFSAHYDRFIVGVGMQPHSGGDNISFFVIDQLRNTFVAGIYSEGASTIFNNVASGEPLVDADAKSALNDGLKSYDLVWDDHTVSVRKMADQNNGSDAEGLASSLPSCDSDAAQDAVKGALANGPDRNLNIQLLELNSTFETYVNSAKGIRECLGEAVLNTGKITALYTFSVSHRHPDQASIVEVRQLQAELSDDIVPEKGLDIPDPALKGLWTSDTGKSAMNINGKYITISQIDTNEMLTCRTIKTRPFLVIGYCHEHDKLVDDDISQVIKFSPTAHGLILSMPNGSTVIYERPLSGALQHSLVQAAPTPVSATTALPLIAQPPAPLTSSSTPTPIMPPTPAPVPPPPTPTQQSSNQCGEPYPCQLEPLIDHNDWNAVQQAITFATQMNIKTNVKWTGPKFGHHGYVVQTTSADGASQCKTFKVVSFMGPDTGDAAVTACQNNGVIQIH